MQFDPVHEEAQFLFDSCVKEQTKGFGGDLHTREEMDAVHGVGQWACVLSFPHQQACGKMRRIDDAKRGGQNKATSPMERIHLCSPYQPALTARLLMEEFQVQGIEHEIVQYPIESGGEDMEDAYRTLPCTVEDLPVNVAAIRHPETQTWTFLQMWAVLFGFESAVLQFGRWSKFCEGAGRRLLSLLWSLYVDDGQQCDLQAAKGERASTRERFFLLLRS